ncbi:hypothetical protein TNCT_343431 [Trichonephila clavata]|uniref:Uncharacterized protein n=1 Tax=Trichonephila clavata TaxID=2740835 RepID=A0A8X6F3I6_TRICU|nr:hypothetical protein TNCT_343431 [Trichonephila clavata]
MTPLPLPLSPPAPSLPPLGRKEDQEDVITCPSGAFLNLPPFVPTLLLAIHRSAKPGHSFLLPSLAPPQ